MNRSLGDEAQGGDTVAPDMSQLYGVMVNAARTLSAVSLLHQKFFRLREGSLEEDEVHDLYRIIYDLELIESKRNTIERRHEFSDLLSQYTEHAEFHREVKSIIRKVDSGDLTLDDVLDGRERGSQPLQNPIFTEIPMDRLGPLRSPIKRNDARFRGTIDCGILSFSDGDS